MGQPRFGGCLGPDIRYSLGYMLLLSYQIQATRVFTLLVGAFWLFAIARKRARRKPEFAHWAMLLFIVCAAANLPWTPEPEKSFPRMLSYSQLFLVAVLVHQAARTTRQYHSLLAACLAGTLVAIAGQFYNFTLGVTPGMAAIAHPDSTPTICRSRWYSGSQSHGILP